MANTDDRYRDYHLRSRPRGEWWKEDERGHWLHNNGYSISRHYCDFMPRKIFRGPNTPWPETVRRICNEHCWDPEDFYE